MDALDITGKEQLAIGNQPSANQGDSKGKTLEPQ